MEPPKFLVGVQPAGPADLPTGRRDVTNVPAQALTLLNDPFVNAMARALGAATGEEPARDSGGTGAGHVRRRVRPRPLGDGVKRWTSAARGLRLAREGATCMKDEAAVWTRRRPRAVQHERIPVLPLNRSRDHREPRSTACPARRGSRPEPARLPAAVLARLRLAGLSRPARDVGQRPPCTHAAESQERHLLLHGRRAEPRRHLRPQADAHEAPGQADRRRGRLQAVAVARQPRLARQPVGVPSSAGKSGLWVSDLFPHLAKVADELCVVRSLVGELPLHGQRTCCCTPGASSARPRASARGCRTAWARRTRNLPGYVVLNNDWVPNGGLENFGSSFLPASHQATMMRARGVPVDNITPARPGRRSSGASSPCWPSRTAPSPTVASDARRSRRPSRNYETAFRMQTEVPELADVSRETPNDPARCTASTRRTSTSGTTPRSACGPGGWSRRGCGSSRSPARLTTATTRRGTSTASSR